MLDETLPVLFAGCKQLHDSWHRKRNIAKLLPQELNRAGVPRPKVDIIARNVLLYINSAVHKFTEYQPFYEAIKKIPSYFQAETLETRRLITEFLEAQFPANGGRFYVGRYNTAALEGFHGDHHQMIGKQRFFQLYAGRTALHNLIWNANRIEDMIKKGVDVGEKVLRGDAWLQRLQVHLRLAVLPARRKKRRARKPTAKKPRGRSVVQELLDEAPNPWEETA